MKTYSHHDGLQCDVRKIEYDFRAKAGYAFIGEGNCVDMRGCIKVFEQIDADVRIIYTIAGAFLDTTYYRCPCTGEWDAFDMWMRSDTRLFQCQHMGLSGPDGACPCKECPQRQKLIEKPAYPATISARALVAMSDEELDGK